MYIISLIKPNYLEIESITSESSAITFITEYFVIIVVLRKIVR